MSKDPYKYFRIEARELCEQIGRGVLDLGKPPFDGELTLKLLRFAHTLKGAARVVKQLEIARRAHALEELLADKRAQQAPANQAEIADMLRLVDEVSELTGALGAPPEADNAEQPSGLIPALPPPKARTPTPAPAPEPLPREPAAMTRTAEDDALVTLRVDGDQMDALTRGLGEGSQRVAALRRDLRDFDKLTDLAALVVDSVTPRGDGGLSSASLSRVRALASDVRSELERMQRVLNSSASELDGELAAAREAAHQLRLVPVSSLFPVLERAVYDAAQQLAKRVEFETAGGDIRLDAHVVNSLREALLHVVRNAVAHGIEAPAARLAAGKSERGRVKLQATRLGGRVVFKCSDDGRGFDFDLVRSRAVTRGLVPAGRTTALTVEEMTELVLTPGFSTSAELTEISGRGIGLDVVKETALRLEGALRVGGEAGRGASIELDVPISVASLMALTVEDAGVRYAVPLDSVIGTARLPNSEIQRAQGRESVLWDAQLIPFVPLGRALRKGTEGRRKAWSVLALRVGDRRVGLGVDRVLGTGSIVMRALPALVRADALVAGATFDTEGLPELVLDPAALSAFALQNVATNEVVPEPLPPILVIDDSLTTRMLEQSILLSAGYRVDLAVSAEDGLEKALAKHYGLFIVDVEMPGMNGFEFVTATRADPVLAKTPAILVTSRDAPEDKLRGQRAGASAYIVKGEFEQGQLLRTIRSLMG